MNSQIYFGQVRHRRFTPRSHTFAYRLSMFFLDLDEVTGLLDRFWLWSARGFNLAWFRRSDHLGSADVSLREAVLDEVESSTGRRPGGRVMLLIQLRYYGYLMNPVCFYFCYREDNETIDAIVAEVNNTPWREQHVYVLDVAAEEQSNSNLRFTSRKDFHVSPFMPMDMRYRWRISRPGRHLNVHIENHRDSDKVFDATLHLERRAVNSRTLAYSLIAYPFATLWIAISIYYQALRLWLKRVPLFIHPGKSAPAHSEEHTL